MSTSFTVTVENEEDAPRIAATLSNLDGVTVSTGLTSASTAQVRYISRLCAEQGMDRESKLEYCRIQIARGVASTKDLSVDEASSVIDALLALQVKK